MLPNCIKPHYALCPRCQKKSLFTRQRHKTSLTGPFVFKDNVQTCVKETTDRSRITGNSAIKQGCNRVDALKS